MKVTKKILLGLVLCAGISAQNAYALGKPTTGNGNSQVSSGVENFLLSLGIFYAKSNPQIGPILTALGINTPADLKKFLSGEQSGSNVQDIVTNAAIQYVYSNPKYSALFQQLGVTDFASLKALLSSGNGANANLLLNLAFNYMSSNPNYQSWLSQLGISDVSDLQAVLGGTGEGTDLKAVILQLAMLYVQANPQYAPYVAILSMLLNNESGGDVINIANPFLGSFEGLSNSEISRIQKAKKAKLR